MNHTKNRSPVLPQSKIYYLLMFLIACALPLMLASNYYKHVLIMLTFYASLSLAWNIIGGYGGQVSFGHAAFYGLGAYTSTLLFIHFHLSPWVGMLIGGIVAVILAVVVGYPCFRLHGPFFSMSTLAVGEVFRILAIYFSGLTRGSSGISIPIRFGVSNMAFEDKATYFYIVFGFFLITVAVSRWIEKSKFGHQLIALREEEDAAEATGVNVAGTKLIAFTISAFLTALGGTFYAQYALYIDPSGEFDLGLSLIIGIMAILGGVGTIAGPILGAVILVPLQEFLRGYLAGQLYGLHLFVYGSLLIIVVTFLPNGVFEWLKRYSTRFRGVPSRSPAAPRGVAAAENAPRTWVRVNRAEGADGEIILRGAKLCKSFGGLRAVRDLDVEVKRGSITGIIGPNGAGKTTFFNTISGFYSADSGTVEYNGVDITRVKPPHKLCRMGIGRTFQLVKPFGNISLVKNTMVGTFCRARNKQESAEEALRVLEFVGLYDKRDNLARSLTIGDRKKLELARALAVGPSLLLLDEILAGLNPAEVEEALQLISTIRNNGVTVLMIEHVMQAVMQLSDHVIVLHEGKKIAEGSPKQVVSDERVIKAYLGEEYVIS